MLRILSVAAPFVSNANAAGESDGSVNDEELAMRAIVESRKVIPSQRIISILPNVAKRGGDGSAGSLKGWCNGRKMTRSRAFDRPMCLLN